jgi:hypothetical protein
MAGSNRPLGSLLKEASACLSRAHLSFPHGELQSLRSELQEARQAVDAAILGYESSDAVNDDEDELVQEALQVRSKALQACRDGEERCKQLQKEQKNLKAHRKELQRATNKAMVNHRRAEDMAKQRHGAFQTLCDEAGRAKAALEADILVKRADLDQTSELSRRLNDNLQGLIAQHHESLAENAQAKVVLQQHRNVDTYKTTKEKECAACDMTLRSVQSELEDAMKQLQLDWENQLSRYRAQITELQGQLGDLQTRYDQKCAVAERELENQIVQKKRSVEEVELQVAAQIRKLEDVRQSKALALRSQIAHHQQRVKDIVSTSQLQMEMQISEVKRTYRTKVKKEAVKCEDAIVKERMAVRQVEKEADKWQQSVQRMRDNYTAHAVKSSAYVKSLDDKTTQRILSLYS